MNTDDELAQVNTELRGVCQDMFPGIQCELGIDVPEKPASQMTILATLGLSSENVRGALVVFGPPEFFRATYPLAGPRESDVRDWAGEVANQTLGRLNNRFARRGCIFSHGIPAIVSGDALQLALGENRRRATLRGRLGAHEVVMVLDVQRTDGTALFHPGERSETVSEGEGILF